MSGIVGIWNLDGRTVSSPLLASLSAALAHRGSDAHDQWTHGPMGLACRLLRVTPESSCETQPVLSPRGTALVFDGRLDNRDELLAHFTDRPDVTAESPDPALVLATYDRFGDRVAEYLNGDFAFGLFDLNRRRLLLVRDAIGIRPLYYTHTPHGAFIFASEIKALLAHPDVPASPNDNMLASYLVSSAPKDASMTCFKDIVSLLPAHCAVVTPERCSTRQYWDFSITKQRSVSFPDYAQTFRHHFTEAVRRRLRSAHPVAVSISGGLDSSSILCSAKMLEWAGCCPAPSVLGMSYLSPAGSPSDEKEFLIEIERQYGLAIERVPIGKLGVMDGAREAVWHVEAPFLDYQWNTSRRFFNRAGDLGVRVMLTGHWADQVLFPQAYLIDLFRQLRWRDIAHHLHAFEHWMPDTFPGLFRKRFWLDLVRYHVPDAVIPYLRWLRTSRPPAWYSDAFCRKAYRHLIHRPLPGAGQPTAHARSLYEEARSPYHVHCMEWNNKIAAMYGMDMAFPFLDRDLLSFLISIPGDVQTWEGVPKALLREGMRGILPEVIANRKWKADFTHLVNEGMERDYEQMLDCLYSGAATLRWGYVKQDVLRKHLTQLQGQIRKEATGEVAWSLTDLLALELWLQAFFDPHCMRNESKIHNPVVETVNTGGAA